MIFGIVHIRRMLIVCAGMMAFAAVFIRSSHAFLLSHETAYAVNKNAFTSIEAHLREKQKEQRIRQQYGEYFATLPRAVPDASLRSNILGVLGKAMDAASFESFDYQFLDPQSFVPESAKLDSTVQIQAEVVLVRGVLRYIEDMYAFLDFLPENADYYELRGCDIVRADSDAKHQDSIGSKTPGLQISCMLNWFFLKLTES